MPASPSLGFLPANQTSRCPNVTFLEAQPGLLPRKPLTNAFCFADSSLRDFCICFVYARVKPNAGFAVAWFPSSLTKNRGIFLHRDEIFRGSTLFKGSSPSLNAFNARLRVCLPVFRLSPDLLPDALPFPANEMRLQPMTHSL